MTRYSDFVKDYAKKKNLSWNCAVCEIKNNGLYKPAPKTRKEPKKRQATKGKVAEPSKRFIEREKEQRNREREMEQMGMEDINVRGVKKKKMIKPVLSEDELIRKGHRIYNRKRAAIQDMRYMKARKAVLKLNEDAEKEMEAIEKGEISFGRVFINPESAIRILYEYNTGKYSHIDRYPDENLEVVKSILKKEHDEIVERVKEKKKREQMGMEDFDAPKKKKGNIITIEDFKNKNVKALSPAVVEYLTKKKRPSEEISKFTKNFTLNKFTNYVLRNKVDLEDVANLYNDEVDRILTKMSKDKTQFKFHLFHNLWKSKINTDKFIQSEIERKKRIVEEKRQDDIERERLSKIPITMYSRNSSKIQYN